MRIRCRCSNGVVNMHRTGDTCNTYRQMGLWEENWKLLKLECYARALPPKPSGVQSMFDTNGPVNPSGHGHPTWNSWTSQLDRSVFGAGLGRLTQILERIRGEWQTIYFYFSFFKTDINDILIVDRLTCFRLLIKRLVKLKPL